MSDLVGNSEDRFSDFSLVKTHNYSLLLPLYVHKGELVLGARLPTLVHLGTFQPEAI